MATHSHRALLGLTLLAVACAPAPELGRLRLGVDDPNDLRLYARGFDGSVQLSWRKGPGAASYRVERNTVEDFTAPPFTADVSINRYTDTGVANGTWYYYRVVPLDAGGAPSGPPSTVAMAMPEVPGGVGAADLAFGAAGTTTLTAAFATSDDRWMRLVEQPNGRILAAGHVNTGAGSTYVAVARYRENGQLDLSWGAGGIAQLTMSNFVSPIVGDIELMPGGELVVGGSFTDSVDGLSSLYVMRLTPDGALDPTFGAGGIVTGRVNGNTSVVRGIAVEPSGAVIACGSLTDGTNINAFVVRYDASGNPDTAFSGGAGAFGFDFAEATGDDFLFDVILDSAGRIVTVGSTRNTGNTHDALMTRLTPDGLIDLSFGTLGNGFFRSPVFVEARYLRVKEMKDRLYTVGYSSGSGVAGEGTGFSQGILVSRHLSSNGFFDVTFDDNGFKRVELINNQVEQLHGLWVFSDLQVAMGGFQSLPSTGNDTILGAFLPSGAGMPGFGAAGLIVRNDSGGTTASDVDQAEDVIALKDGRMVAAGFLRTAGFGVDMAMHKVWLSSAIPGASCADGTTCQSGFCVDGVCCDTACGGGDPTDCQACSLAAGGLADGTCGAVEAGMTCRAASGVCDAIEVCDGSALTCPADLASFDPQCTDGSGCTGPLCTGPRDLRVGWSCSSIPGADPAGRWLLLVLAAWGLLLSGGARARS